MARFSLDSFGGTIYNGLTKELFYNNWLKVIQNDLERTIPSSHFKGFEDLRGRGFTGSNFEDEVNHDLIKKIDEAVSNAIGYPFYVSLLSGIIAITEPEFLGMKLDISIDFLLHPKSKQNYLLNDWKIRSLHHKFSENLGKNYLRMIERINGNEYYTSALEFCSIFMFGFYHQISGKKLLFELHKQESSILSHYYSRFRPSKIIHYKNALYNFINTEFQSYMSDEYIDQCNTIERGIILEFLFEMLDNALEVRFKHRSYSVHKQERLTNLYRALLIEYVDNPKKNPTRDSYNFDFVSVLRDIAHSGENGYIHIEPNLKRHWIDESIDLFIDYNKLSKIIPKISQTFNFYYQSASKTHSTINPNYRLIFDLLWGDLSLKVLTTFDILLDMFYKDKNTNELKSELKLVAYKEWTLNFYREDSRGVTNTPRLGPFGENIPLGYTFSINDPVQVRKAIASLIFYALLYPRAVGSIHINGDTQFLYYDANGLLSKEYIDDSELDPAELLQGSHFWSQTSGFFTSDEYQSFIEEINSIFGPEDIRNFLAMQPPRGIGDANILYYIMHKFNDFFSRYYKEENIIEILT